MMAYGAAKARKQVVDYGAMPVVRAPAVGVGIHVVEGVSLQELVPYIDWCVEKKTNPDRTPVTHRPRANPSHTTFESLPLTLLYLTRTQVSLLLNVGAAREVPEPRVPEDFQ